MSKDGKKRGEVTYQEALRRGGMGEKREAWIYFILRFRDGAIKIGHTTRLDARLASIRRKHGPIVLLALAPGAHQEETAIHQCFAHLRLEEEEVNERGEREREWFRRNEELDSLIRGIAAGVEATTAAARREFEGELAMAIRRRPLGAGWSDFEAGLAIPAPPEMGEGRLVAPHHILGAPGAERSDGLLAGLTSVAVYKAALKALGCVDHRIERIQSDGARVSFAVTFVPEGLFAGSESGPSDSGPIVRDEG